MKHLERTFIGEKNVKIYYQMWIPDKPKAIFQGIHGFGNRSAYAQTIVDELVPHGYIVVYDDHRGHGKSEGETMYVDCFDQYITDEKILTDIILKEYPGLPLFIFGISMGSVIALKYAQKYESIIKGLILTASGTKIGGNVSKFLIFMSKIFSALTPHAQFPSGGLDEFLSHDQEFVRNFVNDPLTHTTKTSARLGYENIIGFSKTPIFASQLTLPVLFVRGADDKLIINAEPLIDALHMVDKTVKIYPGLYHDIFVEPEPLRREPMNDLVQWLDKHVK